MNKILVVCLGLCLIFGLGSYNVWALKESVPEIGKKVPETKISPTMMSLPPRELPDLTVVSAEMGEPHWPCHYNREAYEYPSGGRTERREYFHVPLTITFTNLGAGTYEEFNVGGWGKSIDGNAYGEIWNIWMLNGVAISDLDFWPFFQDDRTNIFEPHRKGIKCDHLASDEVGTYELELVMYSNVPPVTISEHVWRDIVYHTYYAYLDIGTQYEIHVMVDYSLDPDSLGYGYIDESNEMNNELVITGTWPEIGGPSPSLSWPG